MIITQFMNEILEVSFVPAELGHLSLIVYFCILTLSKEEPAN
jgi:hypothetical protein